jgi:hypothetical protein
VRDVTVVELEAAGDVHPGVGGDDEESGGDGRQRQRESSQPVQPRRDPIPAVEVDAKEDRLDKESEALQRER